MAKTIFEEMGGTYVRQGDYYLPCLSLPEEEQKPVGVWGQRHLRYIKEHKRTLYVNLLTSCKLNSYLADIDNQAEEMFSRLVKQLAEKENVTENLKAENQMIWVQKMNNIRNRAMEIVNTKIIYSIDSFISFSARVKYNEPPKIFWKYYDLYRRKCLSLNEYASVTGLSTVAIRYYLKDIAGNTLEIIENPKQI